MKEESAVRKGMQGFINRTMLLASMLFMLFGLSLASAVYAEETREEGVSKHVTLAPVVVSATKTEENTMEVPFFATVITRDDFEKMGAQTIEEALRSVPGLQIGTQGNAYPHIEVRGFRDTKDLAVLIDGIPFRQVNGSADFTMLPLGIVERIEFIKGPSSSIWGRGAVAGVLNIVTKPDDVSKLQAKVQAGGGSFGTFRGDGRGILPYEDGYLMLNVGGSISDGFQDGTDRDAGNVLLQLSHNFTRKFGVEAQYLFSSVNANRGSIIPLIDGEPAYGVEVDDNFGIDDAKYDGQYHSLTVSPRLELLPGLVLKDSASVTHFDRFATGGITITPTTRTKGWWETDSAQTSVHNDLNLTWNQAFGGFDNTLLVGNYLEFGDEEQKSPSYSGAPTYGPPDWQTPLSNVDNPAKGNKGATTRSDFDQTIVSFYIQDRIEYGPLSLLAGVRYDHFDEELRRSNQDVVAEQSDSAWSPRFAADWNFYRGEKTQLALFANYAEGFRTQFPSLSTKNGVTLPNLLDPEETESYEGGLKVTALDGNLFGQIGVFRTEKKGPRSFRTSEDDFLFTNARTRVDGVETEVRYRFNEMFNLWAHYAYHDAHYLEFKDSSGNSFEGYRVRMSPRHIAGAGANFFYQGFNWNVSWNYTGNRNLRDNTVDEPQNLPSYNVVNTAIGYTFLKYEIQFVVNNLFDEYYISDDFSSQEAGCAGAPLNFFVWLKAEF